MWGYLHTCWLLLSYPGMQISRWKIFKYLLQTDLQLKSNVFSCMVDYWTVFLLMVAHIEGATELCYLALLCTDTSSGMVHRPLYRLTMYRVRKLNPTVLHFFSKNAINKLIFNIFCPNLQVMFIGRYFLWLFKKIAASLNNGLNPVAGPPAGLGHDVHDLCLQGGGSVVGAPVDIPLANALSVICRGLQSGLLGGHIFFDQRSCET